MHDLKKCPYCSEDINIELSKCPNCGQWLPTDNIPSIPPTRLLEQNYAMGRFLALAMLVVFIFTNRLTLHLFGLDYNEAITVASIINLGIEVWLLYLFAQYLLNFKIHGLRRCIIWMIVSNIIVTVASLSLFEDGLIGADWFHAILSFVSSIAVIAGLIVYAVAICQAGFIMKRFNNDYVGGLKLLGNIFLATAAVAIFSYLVALPIDTFFNDSWLAESKIMDGWIGATSILIAIGMFKVFTNAEKYQNRMEE